MWYSVSVFSKGRHLSRPSIDPLWLQQIYLVQSDSEVNATKKVIEVVRNQESEYLAEDGGPNEKLGIVEWKYVAIERVITIERDYVHDCSEVYWRYLRDSEAQSLLKPFDDD